MNQQTISEAAAAMGRKGGKRSLETMTQAARTERARKASAQAGAVMTPEHKKLRAQKAAKARWSKLKPSRPRGA